MKMWFPNRPQWIVIWIGFLLAFGWEIFDYSPSEARIFAEGFIIATVLGVWLLEGRRRK